jgi:hypothetical protein
MRIFRYHRDLPRTRRAARIRPHLETLEARTLLSVDVLFADDGLPSAGFAPPDTVGAASYSFYGEAINLQLAFWGKSSNKLISNQALPDFFNAILGGGVLRGSEPVLSFDAYTGQWVVGMLDSSTDQSRFDLAVSNDEDPRDGWYGARYDMNDGVGGTDLADFPRLGYNQDAYVVTFNMFVRGSLHTHCNLLSIDKTDLGNFYRVPIPGGQDVISVNPIVQRDANPGDPLWLLYSEFGGSNALRLMQVSNLTTGPTFSATTRLSVPAYDAVLSIRQPGSFMNWSTDTRLLDASEINGQIVTAQTAGINFAVRARVYQVDVSSGAPVLAQTITIDPGNGVDTYFPAVDMNANGDIGITYMESSASEYMSMYVTGQTYNDCSWSCGSFQTPVQVRAGTSSYTLNQAGAYAGLAVDPSDFTTFWAFNEYKGDDAAFNTGIANFGVSDAAAPGRASRALDHVTPGARVARTTQAQWAQAMPGKNNSPAVGGTAGEFAWTGAYPSPATTFPLLRVRLEGTNSTMDVPIFHDGERARGAGGDGHPDIAGAAFEDFDHAVSGRADDLHDRLAEGVEAVLREFLREPQPGFRRVFQ